MHSEGYYLHQWLVRLNALEERLTARLPAESALPKRAQILRAQVAQAIAAQGDDVLDRLIEDVFLPQLERLLRDVRAALQLSQHARNVKQAMMTPRQARLLQLSSTVPDLPNVPMFKPAGRLLRDPHNRDKIDAAIAQLKALLIMTEEP